MNQDNNGFELSGTLGSLNDTALNNLNTVNNNIANDVVEETPAAILSINNDIEMLDVSGIQPVETNNQPNNITIEQPSIEPQNNIVNNMPNNNINHAPADPIEPIQAVTPENFNQIPNAFEIGDIGSVPPLDPTGKNEKKPKRKNKVLFTVLVIIFILAVGALLFYYLRVSKGSIANSVETKDLNFELGTELPTDINEYATFKMISSSNCILDTKSVDINKVGNYEYTISCGTKNYTGSITLKDSKAPEVKAKAIVKKINDTITPEEFIDDCKESSECTFAFEDEEVTKNYMLQAGTYDLNIIITDANGNSTTVPVKLIVIDSDIKVYLNCVLANQSEENFDGSLSYADKIGISPDSQYVGIYFRIKEYKATNKEIYNSIKDNYKDNGTLSINNGEGTPIFDDNNLSVTFEETLSGVADFGTDYSSIKNYYESTKNYKCNILNVN